MVNLVRAGLLGLLLTVTACGFQLRGNQGGPLPWAFSFEGLNASDPLIGILEDHLPAETAAASKAVIVFRDVAWQRRVLSVGADGKALEYELRYRLHFLLRDNEGGLLLAEQAISVQRDYAFDPGQVLAKDLEESLLRQEMRQQVAEIIERRLRQGLSLIRKEPTT